MRALVFESTRREAAFVERLESRGVEVARASFDDPDWYRRGVDDLDLAIYYPHFELSSSHPHALSRVKDGLAHLARLAPDLPIYPDPGLIPYYNDKFRQALFLAAAGMPHPETVPLVSERALAAAVERLGFPLVLKQRHGAGGDAVEIVRDERLLRRRFELSRQNWASSAGLGRIVRLASDRSFLWSLLRARRMPYPLLGWPLLAQRFVRIERDLKTVVGDGAVVEAHWRKPAGPAMWKMNIDGGAIGEWSRVPPEALRLSERLARALDARWVNLDLIEHDGRFEVLEFSPVWHHYRYREKPEFVYADDYNIETPLERGLDLETLIVESLIRAADARRGRRR